MSAVDRQVLARTWLHSHEEDTPGHAVYRPESFAFPPSRGRSGFQLGPDGTMLRISPGPADKTSVRPGRWELDAGARLRLDPEDSAPEILEVATVTPDRLVLRKNI
jgi:hypothetical protein